MVKRGILQPPYVDDNGRANIGKIRIQHAELGVIMDCTECKSGYAGCSFTEKCWGFLVPFSVEMYISMFLFHVSMKHCPNSKWLQIT